MHDGYVGTYQCNTHLYSIGTISENINFGMSTFFKTYFWYRYPWNADKFYSKSKNGWQFFSLLKIQKITRVQPKIEMVWRHCTTFVFRERKAILSPNIFAESYRIYKLEQGYGSVYKKKQLQIENSPISTMVSYGLRP